MRYQLPFGTAFDYDETTQTLTLAALGGLTCGHNGLEDDYTCSGLAVLGVDARRLEGAKLKYQCRQPSEEEFAFTAVDEGGTVRLECRWRFERPYGIISCQATLVNTADRPQTLRRAFPRWCFSPGDYEVHWQMSRWSAENQAQCQPLRGADLHLHARDARSSIGTTPYCLLRDRENGAAITFHVLPRGNWSIHIHSSIISNEAPAPIVEAGLSDTDLSWELAPGQSVELPEVLLETLPAGDLLRQGLAIQRYMRDRRLPATLNRPPVVYNGWLYRFAKFTHAQLSRQLQAAREVGCEVFIVDFGWFGAADGAWGTVGDWREAPGEPFHGNMGAFADEVRAAGLKFGFWIEPERWGDGIPVRAEHPEWFPPHSKRIDLTQPAAAEHFHQVIADNVRRFGAEYVKIDFNLSVGHDDSGTELYRYCSELQRQMQRLRAEFPSLVIENCGSGALRCDLATTLLYDLHFVSDNANPFETLRIRQGAFRRLLPGRILNWMVMQPEPERRTPISPGDKVLACAAATWDEAALFPLDYVLISGLLGVPGFSGELADFPPKTLARFAEIVAFYKEHRDFFVRSQVVPLTPDDVPLTDYEALFAFQMQSDAAPDTLLFAFTNGFTRKARRAFRLLDLDPDRPYRVQQLFTPDAPETRLDGRQLMQYGLVVQFPESQHLRHAAALYRIRPE